MNNLLSIILNVLLTGQDLFNEQWTTGNLYSIDGVVEKVGNFACIVISFVGFGIVIMSILKNAISGLYVVNPNFWNKVDEIKTELLMSEEHGMTGFINGTTAAISNKTGNQAATKLGGFFTYILSIVPNVRALTDFDGNENIDKKQYFAKSIPLLVAQIFIGMLIFFGYPSKIANWVGSAGTQVLDMLITNVDPVATVTGLADKFIVAEFSYEHSDDPYEKQVFNASKEAWTSVVGRATDIKKEPRQEVAYKIENWVYQTFIGHADTIGATDGFNVSSTASYTTSSPVMPPSFSPDPSTGVYVSVASNGTITYRAFRDVSSLPHGDSQKVGDTDYFIVTFTCTPESLSSTSTTTGIIHMSKGAPVASSKGYVVTLDSGFSYSETSQSNCIVGTPISVSVEVYDTQNGQDVLITTFSGALTVSGSNLQLNIPSSVKKEDLGNYASKKWALNFGFSTSSLKYVAIEGTRKVEVPITSFVCDGNKGLQLSTAGEGSKGGAGSLITSASECISVLKAGSSGSSSTGTTDSNATTTQ